MTGRVEVAHHCLLSPSQVKRLWSLSPLVVLSGHLGRAVPDFNLVRHDLASLSA